jgi:hypothetical protein
VTTTEHRKPGGQTGRRRTHALPCTAELITRLPASWTPTPPEQRATCPGFCERCDHLVRLPLGPGGGLCGPCSRAQELDQPRAPGRGRR